MIYYYITLIEIKLFDKNGFKQGNTVRCRWLVDISDNDMVFSQLYIAYVNAQDKTAKLLFSNNANNKNKKNVSPWKMKFRLLLL